MIYKGTIDIKDVIGKKIKSQSLNGKVTQVDLSNMDAGIYFLSVYSQDGATAYTQRIIKQ